MDFDPEKVGSFVVNGYRIVDSIENLKEYLTKNVVDEYEIWQRRRLSMKPGLTCFWQIALRRNELSFDEWMKLDLEYIDKWSLQLDFMLLIKTAGAVLTGAGR